MNVGDRIKQLRTEKNLTQPQLAQAIGIEQSYLSKLENDKSVPSAEIFQAVLRGLQVDVATFLEGIDENIVHRELRQVPEVANHLSSQVALRVHSVKKWLYGSGIAGVLGLTLLFAGYEHLIFPGLQYTYESQGVVKSDEPSDLYGLRDHWLAARISAGEISEAEARKRKAEILSRMQVEYRVLDADRGEAFIEKLRDGSRIFKRKNTSFRERAANRYLVLLGALLTIGSAFGFFIEMRLRRLRR
jgi:transcriptional regulator with XRE-family HTH domain